MSYSGSQPRFGLSDVQLMQHRVMLARLQELQKQQQHGQLGDVKGQSPITTHLSLFGKQASGGQNPNFSGGMAVNASEIFAGSSMNWMHRNVSSPMQGISSSSYLHDQGLLVNPSIQQPDISLYGTPVASGRGNLGQYSPFQGVAQSSISGFSVDSEQTPISQVSPYANSLFGDKHSVPPTLVHSVGNSYMIRQGLGGNDSLGQDPAEVTNSGVSLQNSEVTNSGGTEFWHKKSKHPSDSRGTDKLDPLEEKILFDTENSGWDSSLSKLAAIGTGDYVNSSCHTEMTSPFSTFQSGSWSALMQSAVAEASSSDTGVQEELSGLSFQNMDLSTDNQPSNLVTSKQQHVKCSDTKSESSSYNLKTPPPSCDSIMSSTLPSFQQTGLPLSFEQGLNKFSSDINIEQWPHLSQSSGSQQQSNQHVPVEHVGNDWVGQNNPNLKSNTHVQNNAFLNCWQADVFNGNWSSALSMSGTTRNIYEHIQNQTSGHQYMSIADGTLDQKDNKHKSLSYDVSSLNNSPMAADAPNKNAAQTYGSQNFQGENSSDSYNSKVSHAYKAQPDHPCLHAADSESSARSSQKSPNQALSLSSPGADSQQECFSSMKSDNVFHTNSNSVIQGKPNLSADALSKYSPALNISGSLDSQKTSELNKSSLVSNHGAVSQRDFQELDVPKVSASEGGPIPDIFSFQNSVLGDSVPVNLGNRQKGQTWWMPSSFGHSVPPLQGALAQNWSAKSGNMGNSGLEISNQKSERSSHGSIFSGPLYVKNQLEGKGMFDVPVASESVLKRSPEMGQKMSLSGSSQDSCLLKSTTITGFQNYTSGAMRNSLALVSNSNQHGMKPHTVQINMSSQRDLESCKVSSNLHNFSTPPYLHGKDQSSLADPSAQSSQITITGEEQHDKVKSHEQKSSINRGDEVCESVETSKMLYGDASMYLAGSTNHQGSITTEQTNGSSTVASSRSLQQYSFTENIKPELDSITANIAENDMLKVDFNSSMDASNLNVHLNPDVYRQQRLHQVHILASNPRSLVDAASHFGSFSSGGTKSPMESAPGLSAFQHIHSHKLPFYGDSNHHGQSSGKNMVYDRIRNLNNRAQIAPDLYKQYEVITNVQILSPFDSLPVSSARQSETFQFSRHADAIDGGKGCILDSPDNQMVTNRQVLASSMFPANVDDMNLVLSYSKKRKFATYDCLPWHKKVMQTSWKLPEISVAEQEWAEATNRLIEKRVNEDDTLEMQPVARCKKRLILTSQLMQQVFRPPTPSILTVDATSDYELVAYFLAKVALADMCSLFNKQSHEYGDIGAAGSRNASSNGHQSLIKDAEELVERVIKLESHIDGLDRSLSAVDIRLECQELEKFCLINHFAKYHSRLTQSNAIDFPSSSIAFSSVRPYLQRYVNAIPLPQNLPHETKCLSL